MQHVAAEDTPQRSLGCCRCCCFFVFFFSSVEPPSCTSAACQRCFRRTWTCTRARLSYQRSPFTYQPLHFNFDFCSRQAASDLSFTLFISFHIREIFEERQTRIEHLSRGRPPPFVYMSYRSTTVPRKWKNQKSK